MKTILLENNGLLATKTLNWINKFDKKFKEINPAVNNYSRSDDLYFFAMLIDPKLQNIFTSSAFITPMNYHSYESFGKEFGKEKFMQLEYFAWLIYEAVHLRKKKNLKPLIININYKGDSFLEDLKNNQFGKDVPMYMKLMLRQSETFVKFNIYYEYEFSYSLQIEEDLKL